MCSQCWVPHKLCTCCYFRFDHNEGLEENPEVCQTHNDDLLSIQNRKSVICNLSNIEAENGSFIGA